MGTRDLPDIYQVNPKCICYVIVISHYEYDIIVIIRVRGKAKDEYQ